MLFRSKANEKKRTLAEQEGLEQLRASVAQSLKGGALETLQNIKVPDDELEKIIDNTVDQIFAAAAENTGAGGVVAEESGASAVGGFAGAFGPPNEYDPFKSLRRKRNERS